MSSQLDFLQAANLITPKTREALETANDYYTKRNTQISHLIETVIAQAHQINDLQVALMDVYKRAKAEGGGCESECCTHVLEQIMAIVKDVIPEGQGND